MIYFTTERHGRRPNRALKRPATFGGRSATETPALRGFLVDLGEFDVLVAERPHDGSRGIHALVRIVPTVGCRGATIEFREPPPPALGRSIVGGSIIAPRRNGMVGVQTGR
ncbi:MAG: hypothetical protein HYV60_01115 [Planctomycetia bacterium]|nr:hypothetical protein [Planctomycetia bacterium]